MALAGEVGADVDLYRGLAANLLAGVGYVSPETGVATAFRPPLVPLIYATLGNADWAILLFQILAGAATAGLTVRLARSLGLAWPAAGIAGAIVACDPILLRYTPRPMTEVTAALLTAGLLCRLCKASQTRASRDRQEAQRRGLKGSVAALPDGRGSRGGFAPLLTGALFGLCALCRPTVWAFGGLLALAWVWDRLRGRAGWLHGRGTLAAGLAGAALIVGPWAARNAAVFGRPILMTTHGGYTLHLANNEVFYEEVVRGPAGAVWEGESLRRWQAEADSTRRSAYFDAIGDQEEPGERTSAVAIGGGVEPVEVLNRRRAWRQPNVPRLMIVGPADTADRSLAAFLARETASGRFWRHSHGAITTGDRRISYLTRVAPPADGTQADRWHRDQALAVIQSDPLGFARAVPLRISRLWGPAPLGPAAEGIAGAALVGGVRVERRCVPARRVGGGAGVAH